MQSSIPILGITGGIASGKSLVAAECARLGAAIVDADQLAHEVLRQPEVIAAARDRWGSEICGADGQIDRRRLAAIVFPASVVAEADFNESNGPVAGQAQRSAKADRDLAFLEELTHPRIRRLAEAQISALTASAVTGSALTGSAGRPDDALAAAGVLAAGKVRPTAIVLDVPLLFEAGWNEFCDSVIFVDAPASLRLRRAGARGWSEEEFVRREARQESLEVKRGLADVVIDNAGSREATAAQLAAAWQNLVRPISSACDQSLR